MIRQLAQGLAHDTGIPFAVVFKHADQAQFLGPAGADKLFHAGPGPGNDQGPLVEAEDFAERVVAAHGHDADGVVLQLLQLGIEGNGLDPV